MVRRKQIRALATELLQNAHVEKPPVPIERIARAVGPRVERGSAPKDISGFLYRDKKSGASVIGVNSDHPRNRQNFTIAHEIGHFLLHVVDDIHIDRDFRVMLRNQESSQGTSVEEVEANAFAAELLMPVNILKQDLAKIDRVDLENENAIADLARLYRVSTQAMTFRLINLGYIRP
ncbi:MAG: ImmA/IrrE family metallo-endopeptidase [Planctomycetes bacterium]|nr:ImmA/IrrE family metallo-endopeptidase [Planctomycetota bacterium]